MRTWKMMIIDSNYWPQTSLTNCYIFFSFIFVSCLDPRALEYTFMNNPLPTLGMVATYLAWVLIIGPIYMRDRKPMDIKNTIIVYNAFQVLLSAYMFYEVSTHTQTHTWRSNTRFHSISLYVLQYILQSINFEFHWYLQYPFYLHLFICYFFINCKYSIWWPDGGETTAWAANLLIIVIRHSRGG